MALFSEKYPLSDFGNAQHKKIANDHIGQEQSGIYNDNAADSYGWNYLQTVEKSYKCSIGRHLSLSPHSVSLGS